MYNRTITRLAIYPNENKTDAVTLTKEQAASDENFSKMWRTLCHTPVV